MGATIVLLSVSLATPWYSFHHSTGRQTPPGSDSDDDGVEERDIEYRPYAARGDLSDEQTARAEQPVLLLGILVTVPLLVAVANLALELLWGIREGTRRVQLVLSVVGFLLVAGALAFVWLTFPALLADEGVTRVFTTRNDQGTFIRTTLSWGWPIAALTLVTQAATFAFKYAGGVFSLAFLDQYRSESR
jgi:hypothetical protein